MRKQKNLLKIALLASISLSIVSCNKGDRMATDSQVKNPKNVKGATARVGATTGISVLPQSGVQDQYYIVSKVSNRALTNPGSIGVQMLQTELVSPGTVPSSNADLTIAYYGNVTNPANFDPGSYTAYRIQWGSMNPNTLTNSFWDVLSSWQDGSSAVVWSRIDQDSQLFVFQRTGAADSSVYIRNLFSGKYLQIRGTQDVNITSGAVVEQWSYSGNPNQKFFINVR
ncbi:RICIN domain-containing protein [Taibaiella soli]|uniref:Ricin B lectin domain-containing protein n=1 Tax=Taibaiella soli TaxID=1649169 RepID=A0A2W2BF94_9BACT|nr:RICIN domain-containing protein [Taibaiella soli]PZF74577.1 hypothetical protein DN068_03090 [Taibaiella soli]